MKSCTKTLITFIATGFLLFFVIFLGLLLYAGYHLAYDLEPPRPTEPFDLGKLRKTAEQGDVDAQRNLGDCYEYGWGVSKNKTEAIKWFTKAAMQGSRGARQALENLGADPFPDVSKKSHEIETE